MEKRLQKVKGTLNSCQLQKPSLKWPYHLSRSLKLQFFSSFPWLVSWCHNYGLPVRRFETDKFSGRILHWASWCEFKQNSASHGAGMGTLGVEQLSGGTIVAKENCHKNAWCHYIKTCTESMNTDGWHMEFSLPMDLKQDDTFDRFKWDRTVRS